MTDVLGPSRYGMDVKSIMPSSKLSHWTVMGACLVPLAIAATALISGVANSAPHGAASQTTQTLAPVPTTTALEVSPTSPVTQGTRVTLTARITPSNAVGNVQFKDGTTDIGPQVQVGSDGTASGSTSMLVLGTRSLTAVFTPADPATFSASTSPVVTYVIAVPSGSPIGTGTAGTAAMATSTTLVTSPTSTVAQGTPVILTATITPSTAVGTVQFKDGGTDIGGPVTVSNNGTAAGSTTMLVTGVRQLTAVFTPANPAMFSSSTSQPVTLTVTRTGAGVIEAGKSQKSGLSLDVRISILGDLDGRSVVLDQCGCPSVTSGKTTILDLDGRTSVLNGNGLLDSVLSVALDLG